MHSCLCAWAPITRLYCDPLNRETKSGARKMEIKEAAIHWGSIVVDGSQKVSSTFWSASKGAAGDVIEKPVVRSCALDNP